MTWRHPKTGDFGPYTRRQARWRRLAAKHPLLWPTLQRIREAQDPETRRLVANSRRTMDVITNVHITGGGLDMTLPLYEVVQMAGSNDAGA